jgi:hypothetical protein
MIHNNSHFNIVAESKNGYVSVCECCYQYSFSFNNLLLVFGEEQMLNFFEWLMAYRYSRENYVSLPGGRDHIYSSPHTNLFLVYNDEELDEISALFAEVQLALEVRKILK